MSGDAAGSMPSAGRMVYDTIRRTPGPESVLVSGIDRKAALRAYKENPPPAGVFRIANTRTGRVLLGSSRNVAGRLNRHRFDLQRGRHADRELQADWNRHGADAFEFALLDPLEPRDEPGYDPGRDLAALEALWREKLADSGATFYGDPRPGTTG